MKDIEFIPFLLTEKADIFSIRLDGNEKTETEEAEAETDSKMETVEETETEEE